MRTNETYLIRSLLEQGRQQPSFAFGRDSKAGRGVEKLYSEQRLQVCSDWRRLAQRSWRQDIRSGASYVIDLGSIFGFLQLVLIWKQRQKLRKLSVIDHSRSIAVEVMGQSLLSCVLAIVCLYVRFLILNIENRRLGRIRRNTDNYFIMLITVFRYLKIECIEKAFVFNSTHRLNQDLWMKKFFGERKNF